VLGVGAGRGSPPPAKGVRGYNPRKNLEILHAISCILVHLWMINIYFILVLVIAIQRLYAIRQTPHSRKLYVYNVVWNKIKQNILHVLYTMKKYLLLNQ